MKNGFTGGLIVDFPNSKKAKKYFLFLMAGYSDEIINDAQKAIMLPKAKVTGEGYSDDSEAGSDEDMEEGEDEQEEQEDESEEDFKREQEKKSKIGVAGRKNHTSKTLQKARKQTGRFKPNGNRKNKKWILQKKER